MLGTLGAHKSALGAVSPRIRLSVVPVSSFRQHVRVRPAKQAAHCAHAAQQTGVQQEQTQCHSPAWLTRLRRIGFCVSLCLAIMLTTCSTAVAAAAPAVAVGVKQAWTQSRSSLAVAIQQLSAPQILTMLLVASFCLSIAFVAQNSGKGQSGSLTPAYEAPSVAGARKNPWEQSGVLSNPHPDAGPTEGAAGARKGISSVLPVIAATSARAGIKGTKSQATKGTSSSSDAFSPENREGAAAAAPMRVTSKTQSGPKARSAKPVLDVGAPKTPLFAMGSAGARMNSAGQLQNPWTPGDVSSSKPATGSVAAPPAAPAVKTTSPSAASQSTESATTSTTASATTSPTIKSPSHAAAEVADNMPTTATPPATGATTASVSVEASLEASTATTAAVMPETNAATAVSSKTSTGAIESGSSVIKSTSTTAAATRQSKSALETVVAAANRAGSPSSAAAALQQQQQQQQMTPQAAQSAAQRLEQLSSRLPTLADVGSALGSTGRAAAGAVSVAAGPFLPLINAPREPATFTTPTARPEIDPIAQIPKIQPPTAKPVWDPLSKVSSAAPPLRATHGATWDPLHHLPNISSPTRSTSPPSSFDPFAQLLALQPHNASPKNTPSADPINSALRNIEAPTRANTAPSFLDPVSQIHCIAPNGPGPGGAPIDPLNQALQSPPPTRSNTNPSMFDPVYAATSMQAPDFRPSWDPAQAIKKFKKRRAVAKDLPSLPRTSLSVPAEGKGGSSWPAPNTRRPWGFVRFMQKRGDTKDTASKNNKSSTTSS